jgi:hypothetical protein
MDEQLVSLSLSLFLSLSFSLPLSLSLSLARSLSLISSLCHCRVEGGHQPLWPETYARMPPRVQRLMVGLHGTYSTAVAMF